MNQTTTFAGTFSRSGLDAVAASNERELQASPSLEIEPTEDALRLIEEGMKELEAGDTVEFADVRARVKARRHGS